MKTRIFFLGLGISALLSACGGGGGGGGSSPSGATVATNPSDPIPSATSFAISSGDSFTYSSSIAPAYPSGLDSEIETTYFSEVAKDGAIKATNTGGTTEFATRTDYQANADFQETGWFRPAIERCVNSPQVNTVGKPLSVGRKWNLSYTRTCENLKLGVVFSGIVKSAGEVVGLESIATPVGTFSAYKVTYAESFPDGSSNGFTCWRDVTSNVTLSCDIDVINYDPTQKKLSPVYRKSQRLVGFNVATFSASRPTLARFAGPWKWCDAQNCQSVFIDKQGKWSSLNLQSNVVSGTVDESGRVTATLKSAATVSGSISPVAGSGSWSNGAVQPVGTWTMTHY